MADEENSGNELAEVLADVCSAADMQTIIGTVRWRSDLPRDHTARRVNGALWWYRPVHQLWKEDRRPSERELRLKSVSRKLRAAVAVVRGLSRNDLDHLVSAGQGLAKVEERLPDVQPELVEVPKRPGQTEAEFITVWDATRQIDASLERLDWLIRCVGRAIKHASLEKLPHGGSVADDPLHTVIRELDKIYFEDAADPSTPGTDIGDGSEDSRTWRESELLDFLMAAVRQLNIQNSREAIYGHWRRATAQDD